MSVQVRRTLTGHPAARYIVRRLHAMAEERAREIDGVAHLNPPHPREQDVTTGTEGLLVPAAL